MNKIVSKRSNLQVFCDGGARGNPGPAAIGFVVKTGGSRQVYTHKQTVGEATNNVAEYKAVIAALRWLVKNLSAINPKVNKIDFFLDSTLVANQLVGEYKVKNHALVELYATAINFIDQIDAAINFNIVPREENQQADALVNHALDSI